MAHIAQKAKSIENDSFTLTGWVIPFLQIADCKYWLFIIFHMCGINTSDDTSFIETK